MNVPDQSVESKSTKSGGTKRPLFGALTIVSPVTHLPFVSLNNHTPVFRKVMPIVMNNVLSCDDLFFCSTHNLDNTKRMLADSGAAISIGNKSHITDVL